jgi:gamma-glutamyltranspeptidase/glutathione hydrolase
MIPARTLRCLRLFVLLSLRLVRPGLAQGTPGVPKPGTGQGFHEGVVAVSHPLAARAGVQALERGNAIDAAAAILFALNVVEPQSSGIGGGGFMMIHLAEAGETYVIDSRERAPAAATPDMFGNLSFPLASTSGLSVGVPGMVRGLEAALANWGTMSFAHVLEPAIALAENGFRVNAVLAADIASTDRGGLVMTALQPETAAIFRPAGVPLAAGDLLVQPDLARTLRLIARKGASAFYRGDVASAIVAAQARTRGPGGEGRMTLEDLAGYQIAIREPVVGSYRGYTLASMPPPSSGGLTILQMLKMLERFPMGDVDAGFGFGSRNTLHTMIEAMRLAFADRAFWMGDEDFVYVPKTGLLADPYVASRSALIHLASRMRDPAPGNPLPFDKPPSRGFDPEASVWSQPEGIHTTHFAVVDRDGNIVTYTNTIESLFGTGITVPGYGFLLNNELTDFNMTPRRNLQTGDPGANDVEPFKRPRSSMSPSILFKDGRPFAAYGSPGGATIINSVLQITLDLLDHGMSIQGAIDAPRISVGSAAGKVACEAGPFSPLPFTPSPAFSPAVLQELRELGHDLPPCAAKIGSVQAVVIDLQTGEQFGGADRRREGTVLGLSSDEGEDGRGHRERP